MPLNCFQVSLDPVPSRLEKDSSSESSGDELEQPLSTEPAEEPSVFNLLYKFLTGFSVTIV